MVRRFYATSFFHYFCKNFNKQTYFPRDSIPQSQRQGGRLLVVEYKIVEVGRFSCWGKLIGYCIYIFGTTMMRLYQFQRIVQNMSQLNLLGESFMAMPSIPNLNHTLLFIETNKYVPISSTVSLDKNIQHKYEESLDEELSLQLKLSHTHHETITSASTIKKKKTGCTCKKTKCLKMYCQCFSNNKLCTEECSCYGCSNDHDHADCITNAKKAIKEKSKSNNKQSQGKGCNCKKSQCQKKYCQCFNAGISCGVSCKCEDCANGSCSDHEVIRETDSKEEAENEGVSSLIN